MTRKAGAAHELLLEIGTEELPSQFVPPALAELNERATQLLKDARLHHGTIKTLGTPRRLTLLVQELADHQAPVSTEVMGPSKAVGFDAQGQPTKAAIGFAGSDGVTARISHGVGGRSFVSEGHAVERDKRPIRASGPLDLGPLRRETRPVPVCGVDGER